MGALVLVDWKSTMALLPDAHLVYQNQWFQSRIKWNQWLSVEFEQISGFGKNLTKFSNYRANSTRPAADQEYLNWIHLSKMGFSDFHSQDHTIRWSPSVFEKTIFEKFIKSNQNTLWRWL